MISLTTSPPYRVHVDPTFVSYALRYGIHDIKDRVMKVLCSLATHLQWEVLSEGIEEVKRIRDKVEGKDGAVMVAAYNMLKSYDAVSSRSSAEGAPPALPVAAPAFSATSRGHPVFL